MSVWDVRAEGDSLRAAPGPDLGEVKRALFALLDPGQRVELRFLPSGRSVVKDAGDLEGLAAAVREHEPGQKGVYWTLNPVRLDLAETAHANKDDIVARRWLLIDADPERPADTNATDEEKDAARAALLAARLYLRGLGWPEPALADSGNGAHALYRVELPSDQDSHTLLHAVLKALAARFDTDRVKIDTKVHNAARICKLPGTWARKGPHTAERPHRMARLVELPDQLQPVGGDLLRAAAEPVLAAGRARARRAASAFDAATATAGDGRAGAYAQAALQEEVARVALAPIHERNNTLNDAAFRLGTLVAGGVLAEADVVAGLAYAAERAGLGEAETAATLRSGLEAGKLHPRGLPQDVPSADGFRGNGGQVRDGWPDEITLADICTVADLERAGSDVTWAWEPWLPQGVLTALAAPGGTGKTRFCADLVRRIRHTRQWPDGQPITLPADSLTLWVAADNNHDELVKLARDFDIRDNLIFSTLKTDPFGGTSLDAPEDYRRLEKIVLAARPALVVVDTVGNATDRNLSRQEDAKAFYQPLQVIARKSRAVVLCLTHLNASGQFLGRRVLEKVRVALRMDRPDPSADKRRLEVPKSFSKAPEALGVVMGDRGNDYDNDPPAGPAAEGGGEDEEPRRRGPAPHKVTEAADWLRGHLQGGAAKVCNTRKLAEAAGFNARALYRAVPLLSVVEFESEGYLWWRLPTDDEHF